MVLLRLMTAGTVASLVLSGRRSHRHHVLSAEMGELEQRCLSTMALVDHAPEEHRNYLVYTRCRLDHPSRGYVTGPDVHTDCMQFMNMYREATMTAAGKSADEAGFCSMIAEFKEASSEPPMDPLLLDHSKCLESLSSIMSNDHVHGAIVSACAKITRKDKGACAQYAQEVAGSVSDGMMDSYKMCDKLVTGKGVETHEIDDEHFLYSCVMSGVNTFLDATPIGGESAKGSLCAGDETFCEGYSQLLTDAIGKGAKVADLMGDLKGFCVQEYHKRVVSLAPTTPPSSDASSSQLSPFELCATTASELLMKQGKTTKEGARGVCEGRLKSLGFSSEQRHAGCSYFASQFAIAANDPDSDVDVDRFCERMTSAGTPGHREPVRIAVGREEEEGATQDDKSAVVEESSTSAETPKPEGQPEGAGAFTQVGAGVADPDQDTNETDGKSQPADADAVVGEFLRSFSPSAGTRRSAPKKQVKLFQEKEGEEQAKHDIDPTKAPRVQAKISAAVKPVVAAEKKQHVAVEQQKPAPTTPAKDVDDVVHGFMQAFRG